MVSVGRNLERAGNSKSFGTVKNRGLLAYSKAVAFGYPKMHGIFEYTETKSRLHRNHEVFSSVVKMLCRGTNVINKQNIL